MMNVEVNAQSIRKNYREMTATEKQVLVNALIALKAKPQGTSNVIDNYANIHAVNFQLGIHNGERFTAWHRWYLHQFEIELRNSAVAGASKINLPYWDWTSQYFTTAPNDQSVSAPLWDNTFIGQFNTSWALSRVLGSDVLPTTTSVNNCLAITTYSSFRFNLENFNHNSPHNWVSGAMASLSSPADPVFYLHHAMVDLIWAKWHNLGRVTSFVNNTLPAYPGVSATSIIDPRATKIWYAENGSVSLDKYTVSNNILGNFTGAENYRYTGIINVGGSATNFFTVPTGQTCNMVSASVIVLKPGTSIQAGSVFNAKVETNSFNTARKSQEDWVAQQQNEQLLEEYISTNIFPNPSLDMVYVSCQNKFSHIDVLNLQGQSLLNYFPTQADTKAELSLAHLPKGIYMIKVSFINGMSKSTQLILQ